MTSAELLESLDLASYGIDRAEFSLVRAGSGMPPCKLLRGDPPIPRCDDPVVCYVIFHHPGPDVAPACIHHRAHPGRDNVPFLTCARHRDKAINYAAANGGSLGRCGHCGVRTPLVRILPLSVLS